NPKKLGTRIAELESQLGLAQEELKSLKDQLSTTTPPPKKSEKVEEKEDSADRFGTPPDESLDEEEFKSIPVSVESIGSEKNAMSDEICSLKIKLEEKDGEILFFRQQNETLKFQLDEKSAGISLAVSEIEQLKSRLSRVTQELEISGNNEAQIRERMKAAEKAKQDMENEMRRLTVQTEQWRKAADAAAAVLSGGADAANCRRISERCGSMDSAHYMNSLSRIGSPPIIYDDVFGSEKRKGSSGIRMLGELLKKKAQK
ncbi:hypothetical protein M569_06051, partial [Genlisea aurea]